MFELISIVFLIIGLGAVIVGTTGIFGYSLMQSITRQQAIYILLAGFFALTIAGRFNVQYLTTSQNNLKAQQKFVLIRISGLMLQKFLKFNKSID